MEDMTYPWTAKIPAGHARLFLTYKITLEDDTTSTETVDVGDATVNSFKEAEMQLSEELRSFIDECVGQIHLSKETFDISFSDSKDFVKFSLTEFSEKNLF